MHADCFFLFISRYGIYAIRYRITFSLDNISFSLKIKLSLPPLLSSSWTYLLSLSLSSTKKNGYNVKMVASTLSNKNCIPAAQSDSIRHCNWMKSFGLFAFSSVLLSFSLENRYPRMTRFAFKTMANFVALTLVILAIENESQNAPKTKKRHRQNANLQYIFNWIEWIWNVKKIKR